ncbi:LytTR family DNA-binding domain-containing protein [uncultured Kordia sp.]|uniref:LytR/AlgR family response regulator transcription factor n=1 Tax=uncultured Kordia sp. TaxID=507699 RepID=UPI0026103760|nr:response regulator transcription factor [uncultured Kordia sp.]
MKVIIIDDERKARNLLQVLISENCPKITEIFEAEDLPSGVELIKKEQPQIVFLDIEMPEHSGLEIMQFLDKDKLNFEIIFTTAYSEYAIKAFQLSAIDYLLKPVRATQIQEAVEKAIKLIGKSQINIKLEELKKSLASSNFNKIGLPFSDGFKFVDFNEIVLLEADGMYTKITTVNDSEILVSKPLKHFVSLLDKIKTFYKPHRSYLINLKFIKEYIKKDGGYIVMDNNETVSISKDKKEEFLAIVQNIG